MRKLVLLFAMISVMVSSYAGIEVGTKFYFSPNNHWVKDGARFAAYFFDNFGGKEWMDLVPSGETGLYEVTAPATLEGGAEKEGTWDGMIFCRMDGGKTANNWDNRWNQTPSTGGYDFDGVNNWFQMTECVNWCNDGVWKSLTPPTPALSWIGDSYIFIGDSPEASTWYNVSGTGNELDFGGADLGELTSLTIGGEVQTYQIVDGVTVYLNCMINDNGSKIKSIEIPWDSDSGNNSKWKSIAGTDIIEALGLTPGAYTIDIWFHATDGEHTVYDSNFGWNYAASFTIPGTPVPALSWIGDSYIFIGDSPEDATWYNASGTGNALDFDGANLGEITSLKIGAEAQTYPITDGVTVTLYCMVNGEDIKSIEIPWDSDLGNNSKWKSIEGTDIIEALDLTPGDYTIEIWFLASDDNNDVYDSNFGSNYTASFTIPGTPVPALKWIGDSFIYIGDSPEAATWYNASGTGNELAFDGTNLGEITTLKIGGEAQTYQIADGVTVLLNCMINGDGGNIQSIEIPWDSNLENNSKWKSTAGTDIIEVLDLPPGDYTIDIWFSAANDKKTVYDSNFGMNYAASFKIPGGNSIAKLKDNSVSISAGKAAISASFEGAATIELFTVNGMLLKKTVAVNSFEQSGLATGLYIIKINGKASKVLVK